MLIKRNLAVPFYVQDERYNVMAWMPMNVYVQDERDGMDGMDGMEVYGTYMFRMNANLYVLAF
jgi:hypothetical protein